VSVFDIDWLALREPHDQAARSGALADRFVAVLGAAPRLIDLGCGTGSNLRYLAPRIRGPQRWQCVDHDPALLDGARAALQDWADRQGWLRSSDGQDLILGRPGGDIEVEFRQLDLARGGLPERAGAGLTGSALLDLTSAAWLEELALWRGEAPLLIALSFDGRLAFEPAMPEDAEIRRRFIAHQRTDKGFGRALGPDAAAYLAERLRARSGEVALAPADWRLGPADAALLGATLAGLVAAAAEVIRDPVLEGWAGLRRQQLAAGKLGLTVGHLDLLALPERERRAGP
jgi:SAM-dependent methyltransferase